MGCWMGPVASQRLGDGLLDPTGNTFWSIFLTFPWSGLGAFTLLGLVKSNAATFTYLLCCWVDVL